MKQVGFTFKNKQENVVEQKENIQQEINYTELIAKKFSSKEVSVKPIFSIPFFTISKLSNWQQKKNSLLKIMNEYQDKLIKTSDLLSSFHSIDINADWYIEFIEKISQILDEETHLIYEIFGSEKYPNKNARIWDAWFQEQKQNMYHGPHNHGMGGLSAVCYLQYDENEHTPTHFISPYHDTLNGYFLNYSENVVEGTMLIFPSNITHYTKPSKSSKSRIILSLNIDIR